MEATKPKVMYAMVPFLVLVWLYSLISYPARLSNLPKASDYKALEKQVRLMYKPGDCISIAPFWAERARLYLGDLPILGLRDITPYDLETCNRLLVLGIFEQDRNLEIAKLAAMPALSHVKEASSGKLSVDVFDVHVLQQEEVVIYDFEKHLEDARVHIEKQEKTILCDRFDRGKWRCPGPEWNYVGQLITDMDRNPRTCIWAHPVQGGTLVIEFKDVPMGTSIIGRHGIALTGVGKNPEPVFLDIAIHGEKTARFQAMDRQGYFQFQFDTKRYAGTKQNVSFSVSTRNNGARHYCFEARVMGRRSP